MCTPPTHPRGCYNSNLHSPSVNYHTYTLPLSLGLVEKSFSMRAGKANKTQCCNFHNFRCTQFFEATKLAIEHGVYTVHYSNMASAMLNRQ